MNNKEIVQKGYERFGNRDISGLLELFADDIKWTIPQIENAQFGGSRHGKDAVGQFFNQLEESEEITNFTPKDIIAEGDKVVVLGESTARVRSTNNTYSVEWVHIFTLDQGKVTNFLEIFDTAEANRAFTKSAAA